MFQYVVSFAISDQNNKHIKLTENEKNKLINTVEEIIKTTIDVILESDSDNGYLELILDEVAINSQTPNIIDVYVSGNNIFLLQRSQFIENIEYRTREIKIGKKKIKLVHEKNNEEPTLFEIQLRIVRDDKKKFKQLSRRDEQDILSSVLEVGQNSTNEKRIAFYGAKVDRDIAKFSYLGYREDFENEKENLEKYLKNEFPQVTLLDDSNEDEENVNVYLVELNKRTKTNNKKGKKITMKDKKKSIPYRDALWRILTKDKFKGERELKDLKLVEIDGDEEIYELRLKIISPGKKASRSIKTPTKKKENVKKTKKQKSTKINKILVFDVISGDRLVKLNGSINRYLKGTINKISGSGYTIEDIKYGKTDIELTVSDISIENTDIESKIMDDFNNLDKPEKISNYELVYNEEQTKKYKKSPIKVKKKDTYTFIFDLLEKKLDRRYIRGDRHKFEPISPSSEEQYDIKKRLEYLSGNDYKIKKIQVIDTQYVLTVTDEVGNREPDEIGEQIAEEFGTIYSREEDVNWVRKEDRQNVNPYKYVHLKYVSRK